MRHPFKIQISDLEPIQSDFEQQVTIEEAKKVVGGIVSSYFANSRSHGHDDDDKPPKIKEPKEC